MLSRATIQRRFLSVMSAAILIANLVLPTGWMPSPRPAQAATDYTWEFDDAGDYTLDNEMMLTTSGVGGATSALQFKLSNFSSDGLGVGLEAAASGMTNLMADSDGTLWGLVGDRVYLSTDDGANWAMTADALLGGMVVYDMVEVDEDLGTGSAPGADLVAVGQIGGAAAIAYSVNGGVDWLPGAFAVPGGATKWIAVAYDTASNIAYTVSDDAGNLVASSDGGETWDEAGRDAYIHVNMVITAYDIICFGANTVAVVGSKAGGAGGIDYSTNGGTDWFVAPIPPLMAATEITDAAYIGGVVYAASSNYLATVDIGGGGTMDDAGDWSDVSANLNGGTFSLHAEFAGGVDTGIMFIKVKIAAAYTLYSTIDKGLNFHAHFADPDVSKMSGGITMNSTGTKMFWAGVNSGDTYADVWSMTVNPANTSTTTLVGPTGVSELTVVGATVHGLNSGEIRLSFSNDTTVPLPTWYYFTGVVDVDVGHVWESGTDDDAAQATPLSQLTAEALADAPAALFSTGNIFVKIYTPAAEDATIILDKLTLTYGEVPPTSLTVTSPNGGERWGIGTTYPIAWTSVGDIANVKIELQRESGGDWETLFATTSNDSQELWEVTGPTTDEALIRISDVLDELVTDTSNAVFSIVSSDIDQPDTTPPSSQVDPLPRYSTADDVCFPAIPVTAAASDDYAVKDVTLYISTNGNSFAPWTGANNPDATYPYTWDVDVVDGETYYFYTIARDTSNNLESPPGTPSWDTMTTMDVSAPTVNDSTPANYGVDVGVNQPIVFTFSESLVEDTFEYSLYPADGDQEDDRLAGTDVTWADNFTKITVTHPELDYLTSYRFDIINATDAAGNQLNNVVICRPPDCDIPFDPDGPQLPPNPDCNLIPQPPLPKEIYFTTQPALDPDLLGSSFTAPAGGNQDGSYNAGDEVQLTLTLVNASDIPASNVATKVTIPIALVTYLQTDDNGGGKVTTYRDSQGRVTEWEWRNLAPITEGHPVTVKFTIQINVPATDFDISLDARIYDNVYFTEQPDVPLVRTANFTVAHTTGLDQSSMTVTPTVARAGDVVTYSITVKNSGTSAGQIEFSDYVPTQENYSGQPPIFFKPGSIQFNESNWTTLPYYDEATETVKATADGLLPNESASFSFQAVLRGSIDTPDDVTNAASVWDGLITPPEPFAIAATVHVEDGDPTPPLKIVYQDPAPASVNNPLLAPIKIGFNRSVALEDEGYPFTFSFYRDNRVMGENELNTWEITWSSFNGQSDALMTMTPPETGMEIGAKYKISITSAYDTEGNQLDPLPSTWEFTAAEPTVVITRPTAPLYELQVGTLSEQFEVRLVDGVSGQNYLAEWSVGVGLQAYLGGEVRHSGSFWSEPSKRMDPEKQWVIIPSGASTNTFYYKDSKTTDSDYLTIWAFENPYLGWTDGNKYVSVVDGKPPAESLILTAPKSVTVNKFSSPITVRATDQDGGVRYLPEGKLYFYATSTDGAFYDSQRRKLPIFSGGDFSVQGLSPQYINIGPGTSGVTLYYLNPTIGSDKVTISDNVPELPDEGLNDASAIFSIQEEEELLLEELEPIVDATGRIVQTMKITPTAVAMLPETDTAFTVTAYDQAGSVIEGLKYGWFVLLPQSGTIEKFGHDGSSKSTFTAGSVLGNYPDTVLVAVMYNGKLAYATADVYVVDVVNYKGPKQLPVTGMNGLQLVLMTLTLLAAVALAWVEHYDKTHFKPDNEG